MARPIIHNTKLPSPAVLSTYGLDLASERRHMPILSVSLVAWGYTTGLRRFLPFSYRAVGAIVADGRTRFLLNEAYVAKQTGQLLLRIGPKKFRHDILDPARQSAVHAIRQVKRLAANSRQRPMETLARLVDTYGEFLAAIGVFNCLNRLAAAQARLPFSAAAVRQIANDRDRIGTFYPQIEKLLLQCLRSAGRHTSSKSDLLRLMTAVEIRAWAAQPSLKQAEVKRLQQRQSVAVYFWLEKKKAEYVVVDHPDIKAIERQLVIRQKPNDSIQGQSAFPGHVRGTVFVMRGKRRPTGSSILVTSMTHPNDLPIVRSCLAIVTNEGGILSHAAVVARELKIPCVIGTKIATHVLKHGDRVEVDATHGTIRKL